MNHPRALVVAVSEHYGKVNHAHNTNSATKIGGIADTYLN